MVVVEMTVETVAVAIEVIVETVAVEMIVETVADDSKEETVAVAIEMIQTLEIGIAINVITQISHSEMNVIDVVNLVHKVADVEMTEETVVVEMTVETVAVAIEVTVETVAVAIEVTVETVAVAIEMIQTLEIGIAINVIIQISHSEMNVIDVANLVHKVAVVETVVVEMIVETVAVAIEVTVETVAVAIEMIVVLNRHMQIMIGIAINVVTQISHSEMNVIDVESLDHKVEEALDLVEIQIAQVEENVDHVKTVGMGLVETVEMGLVETVEMGLVETVEMGQEILICVDQKAKGRVMHTIAHLNQ